MSEIRCNMCGRKIIMCEECFDRFVDDCVVSPEIDDVTEYA